MEEKKLNVAIIGGGPAGLFMFKRLVASGRTDLRITVFEKKETVGPGMPYSTEGAGTEHITNVSDNEIPDIINSIEDWVKIAPATLLDVYDIDPTNFNEYKVLPRLLFGQYLADQFTRLYVKAKAAGIETQFLNNVTVSDIEDDPAADQVKVYTDQQKMYVFDIVIICTGHTWPTKHEGKVLNWFDSPYPPSKLRQQVNFPIAIKGASLTAIDAVRTLARENGRFIRNDDSTLRYELNTQSTSLKLVLHSIKGLLPAIRFHLEDSHLSQGASLTAAEVHTIRDANDGFVPLDLIFEQVFKSNIRKEDPEFYEEIKAMSIEQFVNHMMALRERLDPMVLFKAEYAEAEKSIRRHQSVYWKEMLAALSYAMNYPAKHFCAEDMLRLKKVLMPLISIVIAFVPQSSCRELIALHDAGVLEIVSVDEESTTEPADEGGVVYCHTDEAGVRHKQPYEMFIDAIGQRPVAYSDFPFESLKKSGTVSQAFLRFRDYEQASKEIENGNPLVSATDHVAYMEVPGVSINDAFQPLDRFGVFTKRLYIMAVPLIAGLNPDYSGLDFCETASEQIMESIMKTKIAIP